MPQADLQAAENYFGGGAPPPTSAPAPAAAPSPGDLQSAESYFSSSGSPLPHMPPQSGPALDTVWGSMKDAGGRILSKTGFALSDSITPPFEITPEERQSLVKAGVFNDYNDSHKSFVKSATEALVRNAISWGNNIAVLPQAPSAVLKAVGEFGTQTGAEIEGQKPGAVQQAVAFPFKAAGELATGVSEGALMGEGIGWTEEAATARATGVAVRESENLAAATKARAMGALGEGEAGYYDAALPSPENVQARAESAQEAGITPVAPQPPSDVHELARRVDPDTFQQFDTLAAERADARAEIVRIQTERENTPEALAARADLHEALGIEPGEALSPVALDKRIQAVASSAGESQLERLAKAYDRYDEITTAGAPEMIAARTRLSDTNFAMRDLVDNVWSAYQQAADMAPHLVEQEALKGEIQLPGEQPTAEAAPAKIIPAAIEASHEAAQLEPPSVTGGQKLGGPPNQEGAAASASQGPTSEGGSLENAPSAGGVKFSDSRYGDLKAVEGTGELKTRGLAENVEAKAIEDGLTASFADLPEYRQLNMAEQAASVQKLMDADYEGAKAIAMGEKQPPKGVLPESVYVGVERRALAEGDVDTIQKLATRSKLTTSATTMGQRIRALGERDKASPVGMIQEVQAAREADLARRSGDVAEAKKAAVKEIKDEVKRAASKPDAWASFISSITCLEG